MRGGAIVGAGLLALGIAAGLPGVSAAATIKELQDQAKAHLAKRQVDRAKPILEIILNTAREPGAIRDAARNLAMIAVQQNALKEFLAQAGSELSQNRDNLSAYWKVVEGSSFSKDWPAVIGQLRPLVNRMPRAEALRVRMAQAYASNRQLQEALRVLEDGVQLKPDSPMLTEAVADVYFRANRPDDAIKQYEALLAKSTDERRKKFYRSRLEQIKGAAAKPAR